MVGDDFNTEVLERLTRLETLTENHVMSELERLEEQGSQLLNLILSVQASIEKKVDALGDRLWAFMAIGATAFVAAVVAKLVGVL